MNRRSLLASSVSVFTAIGFAGCFSYDSKERNTSLTENKIESSLDKSNAGDAEEDLDGDGFSVCEEREVLEESKIGRIDVFVEIDWVEGHRPDPNVMKRLVEVYDNAPVISSHGANSGINLHLAYSTRVPGQEDAFDLSALHDYKQEFFENQGRGFHYALFVDEVEQPALGREEDGHVLIQSQIPESRGTTPIQVFAHELGHALGLSGDVFDGIDAGREHSFDEYPSIMNYRGMEQQDYLDFSNGTNSQSDFDDWNYLEENLFVPNKTNLNTSDYC